MIEIHCKHCEILKELKSPPAPDTYTYEARERVLTDLMNDPGLIFSSHTGKFITPAPGDLMLSSGLCRTSCTQHIYRQAGTHSQK